MTDHAWAEGMSRLLVAFPVTREMSPEESTLRAKVYREMLDHLSDDQWAVAVNGALSKSEFFPTIASLLAVVEEDRDARLVAKWAARRATREGRPTLVPKKPLPSQRGLTKLLADET